MQFPRILTNVEHELLAAVASAALVDRSMYGRVKLTGADSIDLLHRISTNDLTKLRQGTALPTIFLNEKGRLIDYVWIIAQEKELILVCSPGFQRKVIAWINRFTFSENIYMEDLSSSTSMLSLLGPEARFTAENNDLLAPGNPVGYHDDGVAYFTDDFHSPSVTIIGSHDYVASIEARLLSECTKMGVEAFDTFRISRGIPLADHEISDRFNPYDAGLIHAVSYTKGCYVGQEVIARLDTYQKARKTLCGVRFSENVGKLGNFPVVSHGSEEVGVLTSVSQHSVHGTYVGAVVIKSDLTHQETEVSLDGRRISGRLHEFPILLY